MIQIPLKLTQAVVEYDVVVTEGAFVGGTTPAWTISGTNPSISHVTIKADEDTRHDYDTQMIQEYVKETKGFAADGINFQLEMVDMDFHTGEQILSTVFPSWYFNQVILYLTVPAISTIASGTPTSGALTISLQEVSVPRALINFVPLRVKKLQIAKSYTLTGDNFDTQFLAQTGAYKAILFAVSTGTQYGTPSDAQVSEVKLTLNDTALIRDNLWSLLKRYQQTVTSYVPSTGFAMQIYMQDAEATRLLNLADTVRIKSVQMDFVQPSGGTGYVTALKVLYM